MRFALFGVAFAGLLALVVWWGVGDTILPYGTWIAIIIGVIISAGVAVGLMALVIISSRKGYDDGTRQDKKPQE